LFEAAFRLKLILLYSCLYPGRGITHNFDGSLILTGSDLGTSVSVLHSFLESTRCLNRALASCRSIINIEVSA